MNKVILIGRLVAEPDVRYLQGDNQMEIARYRLAVNRRYVKDGEEQTVDFINCVAFGKNGEFAEKYLHKGMKIAISGRIQTGSYTNKDGNKIYTTDVVVEEHDFCESKAGSSSVSIQEHSNVDKDGFMNIPDDVDDEGLPFK